MNNPLWFDYKLNMIFNPDKGIVVPFHTASQAMVMKDKLINDVPFERVQTMH